MREADIDPDWIGTWLQAEGRPQAWEKFLDRYDDWGRDLALYWAAPALVSSSKN